MSGKEFNWDEFNKVLQGSSNICAGARKDIENAIKAGKGETAAPLIVCGQVYRSGPDLRILVRNLDGLFLLTDLYGRAQTKAQDVLAIYSHMTLWAYELVAESLHDYLSTGGKI